MSEILITLYPIRKKKHDSSNIFALTSASGVGAEIESLVPQQYNSIVTEFLLPQEMIANK